ncbi:kinesin-like protein KIN-13B [Gossypium hirsutum]|uniref:Kinesin-like protein KIN-13B n=1 Tax=Gossypium hirsutum TaxID=3635 RepID=A0ABM3A125_GOSHI|nr:kinesin-like protein KIN-13B [Gossypium hirsutum]
MLEDETIKELIEKGSATRSTGTSGANEESSRSHAILKLAIKRSVDDLAGSGRGADATDNDKQTSLLALKECIRALDNDQGHIPFRGTTSGVKSLSEGRNPKKDLLSSTLNLKELIAQPLSSVLPTASTFEDDINGTWADQNERDDFDASEDPFEKEKMTWKKNVKPDQYSSSVSEDKLWKPNETCSANDSYVQSLVFSFTQEEEDLVNAHRKQVETMNIVKEEVNLLVEADRPGKQQDGYISRLNAIFSQKADDVVQLQTQIAHFEKLYRNRTF